MTFGKSPFGNLSGHRIPQGGPHVTLPSRLLRRAALTQLWPAGELIFLSKRLVLFLGNPMVKSLKELADRSLKISDIPRSDSTRELILLKHQRSTEFDLM